LPVKMQRMRQSGSSTRSLVDAPRVLDVGQLGRRSVLAPTDAVIPFIDQDLMHRPGANMRPLIAWAGANRATGDVLRHAGIRGSTEEPALMQEHQPRA
jgi:hypothetical protein